MPTQKREASCRTSQRPSRLDFLASQCSPQRLIRWYSWLCWLRGCLFIGWIPLIQARSFSKNSHSPLSCTKNLWWLWCITSLIFIIFIYSFCIFCGARLFKEKGEAAWTCAQVSMSMHKGAVHSQHLEHLRIIGIKSYPSYSESHLLLWLKYSASQGKREPSKQRLKRAPAHERKRWNFNARWQFCHFMADFRSTWCHVQSCPCPKDGFFSWPYVLVKGFDDTDTKFLHCPSQPMCCQKIVFEQILD